MSKLEVYRDTLERWAAWWNGPGREHYQFYVAPPITAMGDALACIFCNDADSPDTAGMRCEVCARKLRNA